MKCADFIQELFTLTATYDGDGNGLCGESYEEVVAMLQNEYPALFEGYKMLKALDSFLEYGPDIYCEENKEEDNPSLQCRPGHHGQSSLL